jgi:hypothetical protein
MFTAKRVSEDEVIRTFGFAPGAVERRGSLPYRPPRGEIGVDRFIGVRRAGAMCGRFTLKANP